MRAEKFKRSVKLLQVYRASLRMFHQGCCILYFCHITIVMQGHRKRVGIWSGPKAINHWFFYLPFAHPDVEHFWWPWIVSIRILDKYPSFLYTKAMLFRKTNSCNYLFVLDLPLDLIKRFTHHKMDLMDILSIKT